MEIKTIKILLTLPTPHWRRVVALTDGILAIHPVGRWEPKYRGGKYRRWQITHVETGCRVSGHYYPNHCEVVEAYKSLRPITIEGKNVWEMPVSELLALAQTEDISVHFPGTRPITQVEAQRISQVLHLTNNQGTVNDE